MHLITTIFLSCVGFTAIAQHRFDVLITECMPDPSPVVGLPAYEWVEVKNVSPFPIELQGWRLGDANSLSSPFPACLIQPDSFVILCSSSAANSLNPFGRTLIIPGFPSLDNDGDLIYLRSANARVIHAIQYQSDWYHNALKKEGGWSLEMIDPSVPCGGFDNWKASEDITGGTPGRRNSVNSSNPDIKPPELLQAFATDSSTILLDFNEPLDSALAAQISHYAIDGQLDIQSAEVVAPLFMRVSLRVSPALDQGRVYHVSVNAITDCAQNGIAAQNKIKTGLCTLPGSSDVVINEILFNPRSGGYDYVELYNRSEKIVDVSKLFVAAKNNSGNIGTPKALTGTSRNMFPGDYIVITQEPELLGMNYLVENANQVYAVAPMPSLPDDEGNIILLNMQGEIIDELSYSDDWHFRLVTNLEGVALERLDAGWATQDPMNWHSAASTAGYGTPTYRNSQNRASITSTGSFEINPKVFSPDNDGHQDIASMQFQLDQPGYMANVKIYDIAGRPVRQLVKNQLAGNKGSWTWDGLDDSGNKLPVNAYIIHASFFNMSGKKAEFKKTVILAK